MRTWLRNLRAGIGATQREIAKRSEITLQFYNYIENGARRPSVKVAKKIAQTLNFDWTLFFEDTTESQKRKGHHNERTTII